MPSVLSPSDLLHALRQHALLEPSQIEELERLGAATSAALGEYILRRDWLTPFQVNRLLQGKAHELFLGQYLLQAKLGEGGMGQVYRVLDRTMDRVVALKLIRPDVLDSDQAIDRFLKEIRAAAKLDHPNIIRAHHAGRLGTTYFLVMEYVAGTDLYRRVKESHPLPVSAVCDWGRQAALALEHVREHGLVHRDVKPQNLLLSATGVVRLLDLGLVRTRPVAEYVQTLLATRQGSMMGTPTTWPRSRSSTPAAWTSGPTSIASAAPSTISWRANLLSPPPTYGISCAATSPRSPLLSSGSAPMSPPRSRSPFIA
jgi:eukaryotic-like serine/threonine-protein kinase